MAGVKLLVVASPYEVERLRRAAAAAGGEVLGAEEHDDLAGAVTTSRPDAIILIAGNTVRDPLAVVRRLRAAAGARTPILFVGAAAPGAAERFADAAFPPSVQPEALVSRALALGLRPAPAAMTAPARLEQGPALRRVAASIDETLNAEMLSALDVDLAAAPSAPLLPIEARSLADGLLEGGRVLPLHPAAGPLDGLVMWEPPGLGTPGRPPSGAARAVRSGDQIALIEALLASDDDADGASWVAHAAAGGEREGDLGDVDAALLLGRLFVEGATGRLVVRRGEQDRTIYFEAGRPVLAGSGNPDDRLIEMLFRLGRVTPAERQMARQAADESGRKMGAVLVELGLLQPTELLPAIRRHYEELVLSLFSWTEGSWRMEPGVMASPTQIRFLRHPAALVREGLRRDYPEERLWRRLGSRHNVFALDLRGGAADVIAELASNEAERRVPLLFDGVRPLDEVIRMAGVPEPVVGALALAAWVFSLLRPAAPANPARRVPLAPRDRDLARERLLARFALAQDGDYFEVLGLPRRASDDDVRRAHGVLVRELEPAVLGPELARRMADEVTVIREVAGEALRVLASPTLRRLYQAALPPERAAEPGSRLHGAGPLSADRGAV